MAGMTGVTYYTPIAGPVTVQRRPGAAPATPRTAARPPQFDFEFVPTASVAPAYRAACGQALRISDRLLARECDGISIAYFRRGPSESPRWAFSSPRDIGGRTDLEHSRIWIASDLVLEQAIRAVAHESRHVWQTGQHMTVASKEQDAYIWAGGFWRRHGAGIESWAHRYGRLAH